MPTVPPTADFYQRHYRDYFKRTVGVDSALFLEPFIRHLDPGAAVLDIGCGSGRDLRWLKNRGFAATGIERSPGLAKMAGAYSGCRVIIGDFEILEFSDFAVGAVMACGSLVHIPHQQLAGLVKRILAALSGPGIAYISLKQGQDSKTDSLGRIFYLWETDRLNGIWRRLGLQVCHFSSARSAVNSKDNWLAYVLRYSPRC